MNVRARLVMAWMVATVASIVVAFAAVGSVRSAIAESPSAMRLPPVEEAAQLPADSLSSTTLDPDLEASDGPPVTAASETDAPSPSGAEVETPETPSTTSPSESPTTAATTLQTTPTTQATVAASESYELDGGWVSLQSTSEGVFLESASPKSGWTVEVENTGPSQVKLEFDNGSREIQFTAEFSDGRVKIEIDD